MPKKMGRPKSENPKSKSIHVRLDSECENILKNYCEKERVQKTEAIRRGIKRLGADK